MAFCCSCAPESLTRRVVKALCAALAAIVYTDSALHAEFHGTASVLTRWMAAALWILLAALFLWRVFRPAACTRPKA